MTNSTPKVKKVNSVNMRVPQPSQSIQKCACSIPGGVRGRHFHSGTIELERHVSLSMALFIQ